MVRRRVTERINPDIELHNLRLRLAAPPVVTPSTLITPIEDFSSLYRMSTGVYGKRGYRRLDQPFPYARPYLSQLRYGSPLGFEVVVPTTLVLGVGAWAGLPKLLDLLKQVMLFKSSFEADRERNLRDREQYRLERERAEAQRSEPEAVARLARAQQRADIAEAENRELSLMQRFDPDLTESVRERYGPRGVKALKQIAKRTEDSPVDPSELDVEPLQDPGHLPPPPRRLPPN